MPHLKGRGTYKGYKSPATTGYPKEVQDHVRRVYGAYREKHPGENPKVKARAARIAWASAKREYPDAFRKHDQIVRGTKIERKEHPTLSDKQVETVARDHIREDPNAYPPRKMKANRAEIEAARIAAIKGE